jgi:hypothetical protein
VDAERLKPVRNVAIILAITLLVWKAPGGGTAADTILNLISIAFLAGICFFGYRLYMEHRDTILSLQERQRGLLYGALALLVFALVATGRMWDSGLGILWLALLGVSAWALYSVWRSYRTY